MSNNNLIIILLLVSFLVIGVSALAVNFLIKTITLDSKLVSKKLAAEKQLKENILAAPNLIEAYRDLGNERVLLEDALPIHSDFPSLLVTLENMSLDAPVALTSVTESLVTAALPGVTAVPTTAEPASASTETGATPAATPAAETVSVTPKPETYAFTINVKGTYGAFLNMLDHLEKSARPMRITGMQILGTPTSLDVNVSLETYFQKSSELPFGKETVK
jgi:hypothetical protein